MGTKTGSSYVAIDSPIDRLDPMVKFVGVFALGLSTYFFLILSWAILQSYSFLRCQRG